MNRIQGASDGYNAMVSNTPVMWTLVGMMIVLAFFLGGYLVMRMLDRYKREKLKLEREAAKGTRRKRPSQGA
ncbi:hypothetical protein Mmc1_0965 [Magnetococcus marinus MC-1]|uniref:Uncharacterized protein n=1 Tax=Magnetococcus marinus (strain ATCC BAA-1437 / JCM 17883 / MC-1) TaxID=156889 RepID=A0L690_MAGMM|nr:hypothetical protein [Magnetococcus marinus]ABK43483.1 hypothetical protein Mmc1_0965 [Magnetococcus marinus MC-1]